MSSAREVCVIASGHLSTCPRMMKAADALRAEGFGVRIACSGSMPWLEQADAAWFASGEWRSTVARFGRQAHPARYLTTGIRYRFSRRAARTFGAASLSTFRLGAAFTRPFAELVDAVTSAPADLYYAGTSGGIAVAAEAARRTGVPYALDLEDFHSAEQDPSAAADLSHRIIEEIERRALPGAKFLSCGSDAMASAYAQKYAVRPAPIHNVFPLPSKAPDFEVAAGPLKLVWLSQTVGPGRGLEDAIRALGMAARPAELLLRGVPLPGYLEKLAALIREQAPNVRLRHSGPEMERSVVDLCRGSDIGLALEQTHVLNRALCLCNKPFTYMLAGLAVAFTDTPGQRTLAMDLGRGAALFPVGDAAALAGQLARWADDRSELAAAKRAAWEAAARRWHWEHPEERGRLVALVRTALAHP